MSKKPLGPQGFPDTTLKTVALDRCARSLRQGGGCGAGILDRQAHSLASPRMVFSLHAPSRPGDLRVLLAFPEASSLRESSSVQEANELAL